MIYKSIAQHYNLRRSSIDTWEMANLIILQDEEGRWTAALNVENAE